MPPYESELINEFGITKFKATKEALSLTNLTEDDEKAKTVFDMFEKTNKYAKTEIAVRVLRAFS